MYANISKSPLCAPGMLDSVVEVENVKPTMYNTNGDSIVNVWTKLCV